MTPQPEVLGEPPPEMKRPDESLAQYIHRLMDMKSQTTVEFIQVCLDNAILFDKKQMDYGSKNIAKHGTYGVLVRMSDKMLRLENLMGRRRRKPQNEALMDSFRDISNYANIAVMVETNKWPKE